MTAALKTKTSPYEKEKRLSCHAVCPSSTQSEHPKIKPTFGNAVASLTLIRPRNLGKVGFSCLRVTLTQLNESSAWIVRLERPIDLQRDCSTSAWQEFSIRFPRREIYMTHMASTLSGQACGQGPLPAPPGQGLLMSPLSDECGPGSSPSDSPLPATLHKLCSPWENRQDATGALPSLCA